MNKREEMLNRIVAIAKRNGYDISDKFFTEVQASEWFKQTKWPDLYFSMLFSKSFAFHYWGDNDFFEAEDNADQISLDNFDDPATFLIMKRDNSIALPSWQFHQINMLISDDPLEYAYKFADECDRHKPIV